ncbi:MULTISPECIES: hypothetical protein [unclassified Archaeoglobus]|jgi:hypothetical protein|uniref:hypothetical protein n=1 Tax=unclassified Archaeoglobus TaxID=2643606 RepID=UPI0025B8E534|nr:MULTISPECIES: hypothetical protein [unclassified Archaeoglobus]
MSLICRILGHRFAALAFPPQQPDSLILICMRCGFVRIIHWLDGDYFLEDPEDEVEGPAPQPEPLTPPGVEVV